MKKSLSEYELTSIFKKEIKKDSKFANAFCEKAGLSRFTMSKIFNGRSMAISSFVKILKALKKLSPETNFLRGMDDLSVDVILQLYNNRKKLDKLFDEIDKLRK